MHEGPNPAETPTALREAVLRYYDEFARLFPPGGLPMTAASLAEAIAEAIVVAKDQAVGLFAQATGTDRDTASVEVDRLAFQLAMLGAAGGLVVPGLAPGPGGVDRAELETAAAALLGYYLADRRTGDELLGEVVAVWAEFEDRMGPGDELPAGHGPLRQRGADDRRGVEWWAFMQRYLMAWRRWLDRQAERGTAGGPAGR